MTLWIKAIAGAFLNILGTKINKNWSINYNKYNLNYN